MAFGSRSTFQKHTQLQTPVTGVLNLIYACHREHAILRFLFAAAQSRMLAQSAHTVSVVAGFAACASARSIGLVDGSSLLERLTRSCGGLMFPSLLGRRELGLSMPSTARITGCAEGSSGVTYAMLKEDIWKVCRGLQK